jgi:polar amino acid transport system substrate-binding protein
LLVTGTANDGKPVGVSPSLAAALSAALAAPLDLVTFADPSAVVDAVASGVVDIGNVGADSSRATHVAFTGAYCEIEAAYLVRAESTITDMEGVDRRGVRIASRRGAAYTLWLDRNIAQAEVIHCDNIGQGFEMFLAQEVEVLAGLRPGLMGDAEKVPGSRLLDDRFTTVEQAIGIHRDRAAVALSYLERFVDWAIRSRFVAELIEYHGVRGLSVAAPGSP